MPVELHHGLGHGPCTARRLRQGGDGDEDKSMPGIKTPAFAAVAAVTAIETPAIAQEWPKGRPIKWMIGLPPGGGVDPTTRGVADKLGPRTGAATVIENKPGANQPAASATFSTAPAALPRPRRNSSAWAPADQPRPRHAGGGASSPARTNGAPSRTVPCQHHGAPSRTYLPEAVNPRHARAPAR